MKLCFMVNLTEELVVAICVDIQCWIPVSVSGNITSFSGFFLSYTTIKDAKLCIQTETWAARTDVPLSCGLPFKNTSHFQHFQTSLVRSSRSEPRWMLWVTHTYIYLDPLFQRPWRYKVCLSIKALPLKARRMGALLLFPSRSRRRGSVREAIGCCCRPLSECSPSSSRTRSQMDFFYFQRRRSQGPGCVLEPSSSSKSTNSSCIGFFFFVSQTFSLNCELFLIMSGEFNSQQAESCCGKVARGTPAFFENLLRRMRLAVMGCEATAHTRNCFLRVLTFLLRRTLFTGSWWLSATPQGVCVTAKHTHTHTTDSLSLSPRHTTLGPTSLCPLSLPLHHNLPPSFLCRRVCVCADIHVRVVCVCIGVWVRTRLPRPHLEIWLCLPGLYILTRPFSRKPWSPLMEEAPATNSSETRHSNRSQAKWRRHALNDICGPHSCTVGPLLTEGGCCIKTVKGFVCSTNEIKQY